MFWGFFQDRNTVHQYLLQLDLPNLVDSGEAEVEKLRQVSARQVSQHMLIFLHSFGDTIYFVVGTREKSLTLSI